VVLTRLIAESVSPSFATFEYIRGRHHKPFDLYSRFRRKASAFFLWAHCLVLRPFPRAFAETVLPLPSSLPRRTASVHRGEVSLSGAIRSHVPERAPHISRHCRINLRVSDIIAFRLCELSSLCWRQTTLSSRVFFAPAVA